MFTNTSIYIFINHFDLNKAHTYNAVTLPKRGFDEIYQSQNAFFQWLTFALGDWLNNILGLIRNVISNGITFIVLFVVMSNFVSGFQKIWQTKALTNFLYLPPCELAFGTKTAL